MIYHKICYVDYSAPPSLGDITVGKFLDFDETLQKLAEEIRSHLSVSFGGPSSFPYRQYRSYSIKTYEAHDPLSKKVIAVRYLPEDFYERIEKQMSYHGNYTNSAHPMLMKCREWIASRACLHFIERSLHDEFDEKRYDDCDDDDDYDQQEDKPTESEESWFSYILSFMTRT